MDIIDRVYQLIQATPMDDEIEESEFNDVACELARFQYQHNEAYKRYCDFMQEDVRLWTKWEDILPLPVSTFKQTSVRTLPLDREPRGSFEWHSSGTTGTNKSRTYLRDTGLYDLVIKKEAEYFLPLENDPLIILAMPKPQDWPNSSLSHMYRKIIGRHEYIYPVILSEDKTKFEFDFDHMTEELERADLIERPIALLTTSYGLVKILDYYKNDFMEWPEGSLIVDTGGFKGITREVSRYELKKLCLSHFSVPPEACVNEYGMSELSSQFWTPYYRDMSDIPGLVEEDVWVAPPWVRTRTVSPWTFESDTQGVLQIVDLASVWSCCSILTEDLAELPSWNTLIPRGRVEGADQKGCSINSERAFGVASGK